MTDREAKLRKIYRETHRDFKGVINGTKTVMIMRGGWSVLAPLDSLTDDEIARF